MFDLDKWQEIFSTIRKNKLRTFLTGFSVAWGIFMLVVLLGSGVGLENGIRKEFEGDAINMVRISGGRTSVACDGMQAGRDIRLTNDDYDRVQYLVPQADNMSARRWVSFDNSTISYRKEYGKFDIMGAHPDMKVIEQAKIEKGRFINDIDVKDVRKVTVISKIIAGELFRHGEQPVGEYVKIGSIPFRVVGVYEDASQYDNRIAYIPITTAQKVFAGSNRINNIMYTTGNMTAPENEASIKMLREDFAKRFRFDPKDERALWIRDNLKDYQRFQSMFFAIGVFVWVIGLGTIAAGIVGVSNIMVIVVKERTKEIGIRKALGATSGSIVGLILLESVFITTFAGYFGLAASVGLLELLSPLFENSDSFFLNPHADFGIAMGATLVLIISGTLAGFVPARRASRIKPIEALRDE
ncbi:MAG: ABC transporter permease [Bacteroidales bacterium]|jgi:putative ABC transport system permease protein|nr:ABC transporter permease [Bacteroidales bacterium]